MPISISTGRKMQMFLLDLLYPNRCPCCNCSISWREYLCEACRQEVTAEPADAFCPLCGKLLRDCFCGTGLSYDRAAILTEYTGAARAGVLSMKSAASLHFGRFCGNVLGQRIAEDAVLSGYDLVVPVPMQLRKQRKRCCNPAAVFAREIAAVTRIPYRQDILHDNGTGKTQHTLSAAERHKNVEQFSGYDADCYYLVPSWIVECAYVDKPKKDYQSYYEPQTRMITINAQTGEMLDRFDKSYKGYGDARYKGFIPWDKVK